MSKSLSYFKAVTFCLLHFALKSCPILRQKLLHFGLMLHFASKVVIFRVNVTFSVTCYILRRNRKPSIFAERVDLFPDFKIEVIG